MEYIYEHWGGAPVKRVRPDGTEYVVAWCVHCGAPNNSFTTLNCIRRIKPSPAPGPRRWVYMDFDAINRKFVALDEQARGYCKNRDPDFVAREMPADYRCWCYTLAEDSGGGSYPCPTKEDAT